MNIIRNIRWALTVFLCIIIWMHSHWSVALSITLISFSIEGLSHSLQVVGLALKAHIAKEKKDKYDDILK
jgi:hypothetical protein